MSYMDQDLKTLRCVKDDDIKNLVVDLQADNNPSMWITLGEPSKLIVPRLTSIQHLEIWTPTPLLLTSTHGRHKKIKNNMKAT